MMKAVYLNVGLFLVVLLGGCKTDKTREFIPGTYVTHWKETYNIVDDTLRITAAEGNNYFIERRTGFNRIEDGIVGARKYEIENWVAVYDESKQVLVEVNRGKVFSFYPDSAQLRLGTAVFGKINK